MANGYTYEIRLRDLMTAQLNRAKAAAGSFSAKMVEASQRVRKSTNETGSSITQLNQKLASLTNKRDNAFSTKQIGIYNRSIRQTQKELDRLSNLPRPTIMGRFQAMGSKIGSLIGLTGGLALAMGAIGAVGGIVKMGAELEQTRISFQTMMGSAKEGNEMLSKINALGAATPYNNKELQDSGKLLLGFGVDAKKILPTLGMIGDVASGNSENMKGLTLAFAQVSSAGKLQGQDLMQMINAGFNPLSEISRVTGESMGSLKDRMSKGGISANEMALAFEAATSKGGKFHEMSLKQSETLSGRWSTFTASVTDKMAEFGEKLTPYLADIVLFATSALEGLLAIPSALKSMWKWLDKNKIMIALVVIAVAALTFNLWAGYAALLANNIAMKAQAVWAGIITTATWLWNAAQWAINAAMNANPIGIIIGLIALLVGAIYYVIDNWDYFGAKWDNIWTMVKNGAKIGALMVKTAFTVMGMDIQILWQRFKGFGQWVGGFFSNIGKSIKLAFSGDFSGAKKALFAPIKVSADAEIERLQAAKKKVVESQKSEVAKLMVESANAATSLMAKETPAAKKKKALDKNGASGSRTAEQIAADLKAEADGSTGTVKDDKGNGKGNKGKDKADEIVTGGKKSMIYNITIENVVKDIHQNISNGKGSADELVDQILDQLTRRLSGTFKAATE